MLWWVWLVANLLYSYSENWCVDLLRCSVDNLIYKYRQNSFAPFQSLFFSYAFVAWLWLWLEPYWLEEVLGILFFFLILKGIFFHISSFKCGVLYNIFVDNFTRMREFLLLSKVLAFFLMNRCWILCLFGFPWDGNICSLMYFKTSRTMVGNGHIIGTQ